MAMHKAASILRDPDPFAVTDAEWSTMTIAQRQAAIRQAEATAVLATKQAEAAVRIGNPDANRLRAEAKRLRSRASRLRYEVELK